MTTTHSAIPHIGIGPVKLGMNRALVAGVMNAEPVRFRKVPDAQNDTDAFDEAGFHVYYSDDSEAVELVEVFPVERARFMLFGIDVFATPAVAVIASLKEQESLVEEEAGCSYRLSGRDVVLWRGSAGSEFFESLAVGRVGYCQE